MYKKLGYLAAGTITGTNKTLDHNGGGRSTYWETEFIYCKANTKWYPYREIIRFASRQSAW